jgi:hypothetical protein
MLTNKTKHYVGKSNHIFLPLNEIKRLFCPHGRKILAMWMEYFYRCDKNIIYMWQEYFKIFSFAHKSEIHMFTIHVHKFMVHTHTVTMLHPSTSNGY